MLDRVLKGFDFTPYYFGIDETDYLCLRPNVPLTDTGLTGKVIFIRDLGPDFYWENGRLRVVTNPHDLNQMTLPEHYPMNVSINMCVQVQHLSNDFVIPESADSSLRIELSREVLHQYRTIQGIFLHQYSSLPEY